MKGASLPYSVGDWYWLPSRAIPAPGDVEPITEFPFFTFLYADLHAHMIALPLTVLALGWAVSVVLGRGWNSPGSGELGRRSLLRTGLGLLLGGLTIGALRPTNTWDFPMYLVLGIVALGFAAWRQMAAGQSAVKDPSPDPGRSPSLGGMNRATVQAAVRAGVTIAVLTGLAFFLFQPYSEAYVLGYYIRRRGIQSSIGRANFAICYIHDSLWTSACSILTRTISV